MNNMPKLKIGVVAVSRDCFPESLSVNRRAALMKAYTEKVWRYRNLRMSNLYRGKRNFTWYRHWKISKKAGCNALVVYLGNFGPEIAETLLAKQF